MAKKDKIVEISREKMLDSMQMDHSEFVDLCILLGCDYCETLKGIGMKRAVELIKKYRSIESIASSGKYTIPDGWKYRDVHELFMSTETDKKIEFATKKHDSDGLHTFLVVQNGFSAEKVDSVIARLDKVTKVDRQKTIAAYMKKK